MIDRPAREALIDSLEIGDLIRLNGRLRVVRSVGHRRNRISSITCAILKCSWTKKPFTVINRADMYLKSLEIVHKGYGTVHQDLERLLQDDIEYRSNNLKCCDVIGVIS